MRSRAGRSPAARVSLIVSVSPRAVIPLMCGALPAAYAARSDDVRREAQPRRFGVPARRELRRQGALDRVPERLGGDHLAGGRREPEAGPDAERVRPAVARDGRHRGGDLGPQHAAGGPGCVRVVQEVRAGGVGELVGDRAPVHRRVGVSDGVVRERDPQRLARAASRRPARARRPMSTGGPRGSASPTADRTVAVVSRATGGVDADELVALGIRDPEPVADRQRRRPRAGRGSSPARCRRPG